jgi:hypothetical protein
MRANITLRRHREGRLLEERKFPSRSWLVGMMELLYLAHAQIQYTAPYTLTDILGQARECDCDFQLTYYRGYKGNLAWSSPGGYGSIFVPTGSWKDDQEGPHSHWEAMNFLKGDTLGIQIGGDNTAVAPDDYALGQKVFHGQGASIAGPASFSEHTAGDTAAFAVDSADDRIACLLIPERGFRMSSVKLLLYRTGNPGNMTLRIKGVRYYSLDSGKWLEPDPTGDIDSIVENANTLPVGAPYEWREFTLTTPIDMQPGMMYAFALECATADAANKVNWRYEDGVHPCPNWNRMYSVDGEVTWTPDDDAMMMIDPQGSALAEMEYCGCGMYGKTIVNPNGEFSIARLFRNSSGEAIGVEEVGLYAAVTRYVYREYNTVYTRKVGDSWAACAARDVVAPALNVLNGETLEVVYTPQITV